MLIGCQIEPRDRDRPSLPLTRMVPCQGLLSANISGSPHGFPSGSLRFQDRLPNRASSILQTTNEQRRVSSSCCNNAFFADGDQSEFSRRIPGRLRGTPADLVTSPRRRCVPALRTVLPASLPRVHVRRRRPAPWPTRARRLVVTCQLFRAAPRPDTAGRRSASTGANCRSPCWKWRASGARSRSNAPRSGFVRSRHRAASRATVSRPSPN